MQAARQVHCAAKAVWMWRFNNTLSRDDALAACSERRAVSAASQPTVMCLVSSAFCGFFGTATQQMSTGTGVNL